jgi:hypothetical protein
VKMTDKDRNHDITEHHSEANALDRELDAALAKLASVEPRAGLEQRLLANLRIEQERATARPLWRWPAVAALAAAMVVAVFIARRAERPAHKIADYTPANTQANNHSGTQLATNDRNGMTRPHEASVMRLNPPQSTRPATALSAPKLDQFPSPQPLSEQEKILASYVTNYPAHAALIAQARTDELRRDSAEEVGEAGLGIENSQ